MVSVVLMKLPIMEGLISNILQMNQMRILWAFFLDKRTKERLADIVYYDNHSISPIGSNNRQYTFEYYNHNLRIRKGDFA